jgi:hypothetical protein
LEGVLVLLFFFLPEVEPISPYQSLERRMRLLQLPLKSTLHF